MTGPWVVAVEIEHSYSDDIHDRVVDVLNSADNESDGWCSKGNMYIYFTRLEWFVSSEEIARKKMQFLIETLADRKCILSAGTMRVMCYPGSADDLPVEILVPYSERSKW